MPEIGSTLREARMRARIDITEVEAATKIRAKYLRAIENEEWDLLPGAVYVKSFLKTYAEFLGIDSRLLLDEYKRRYERLSDHELRPLATLGRERERAARGPLVPAWAIIAVVLVGVVAALWLIGNGTGGKSPTTPVTGTKSHHPHQHPTSTPQHTTPPHRRPPTPRSATLELQEVGPTPVYICVVNHAGKKLIPGVTYAVGAAIPTVVGRELLVTLGNNSVKMRVNGKPYTVAASANAIGLRVKPTGVTSLTPSQEPSCT
jgi:cytoskeletal protein RodZ